MAVVLTSRLHPKRFVSWRAHARQNTPQERAGRAGHSSLEPPTGDVPAWRALIAPLAPETVQLPPWPGGVINFSPAASPPVRPGHCTTTLNQGENYCGGVLGHFDGGVA